MRIISPEELKEREQKKKRDQRTNRIVLGIGSLILVVGLFLLGGNAWRAHTLSNMQQPLSSSEIKEQIKKSKQKGNLDFDGSPVEQDKQDGGQLSSEKSRYSSKGGASNVSTKMDYDSVSIPSLSEVYEANKPKNREKAMAVVRGTISIPSVNIHLNILEGTNATNMLYGATTMLPHQQMGKGNYVLAGHNMKERNVLFSNLIWDDRPQVHKGDKIYLSNGEKTWRYVVTSTETVSMYNTKCLEESEEPIITLFTCTKDTNNSGKTKYRFVVHGKLAQ